MASVLVAAVVLVHLSHLFLFHLPKRDVDHTALTATELVWTLRRRPDIQSVAFCGGERMGWGSNQALPYMLPEVTVEEVPREWFPAADAAYDAVITTWDCTDLRDRLVTSADYDGTQLIYRRKLDRLAALRMYLDTGGVGYMREVPEAMIVDLGDGDEVEVYTLFEPSRRDG